ncbi:mycofactocin dehydrogenase MftG [Sinomonas flava]|uniref:Mycofactocin system GMC family oxidoreductase MftG n=1 Tax=Sinomonas flava TaxID=496857 RepID=A0ABP5NJG6_9MICC
MTGPDVIVVGAGSSGCVVAARLSEDESCSVLLLEAGQIPQHVEDFPAALLDGGTVQGAAPHQPINWTFPAALTPERPYETVRGRILGGSSTINGGYFIRPRVTDFERWAIDGGPEWSYRRTLPALIAAEADAEYGRTPVHGDIGPVPVHRAPLAGWAGEAFEAAAAKLGFPPEPDKNDQCPPGFGPVPTNVSRGIRHNAGMTHLLPALHRPNLSARGGATATRLLFAGGRAVGVEYRSQGRSHRAYADRIVLCAGAIGSAHLLMLSGVGPAEELSRAGVPVLVDSPTVGSSFSDHPQLVVEWSPRHQQPAAPGQWMGGCLHTDDLEVIGTVKPMRALLDPARAAERAPLALMTSVQRPRNTGRLRLASADADVPPFVEYGYLRTERDRRDLRDAARLCAELLGSAPWRAARAAGIGIPDTAVRDDRALDSWIAAHLGTSLHTCGTVPFGGAGSAVDGAGAVRGVEGLTVADTSILPTAPRRGPAVAALLVGEVIAARLRTAPDPPRAVVR